jgi:hypothetical protein
MWLYAQSPHHNCIFLAQAQSALDGLRAGRVVGRTVLAM